MEQRLTFSDNGLNLTKQFEGKDLTPYNDAHGFATVGYGHLIRRGPVEPTDNAITQEEAEQLLRDDTRDAQNAVNKLVTTQLNQNQFDAIVDFVYNLGAGAFEKSWVLRYLNNGNFPSALWHLGLYNTVGGVVEAGLTRRRQAEIALFNS